MIILIALVINLILSIIVANAGEERKIGYLNSLFISLMFGGLIGILLVLSSRRIDPKPAIQISRDFGPKDEVQIAYERRQKNIFTRTF